MARVEAAAPTALTPDDVASVQVFLRGVTCAYLPKQAFGELAVSGTTQWSVVAASGTRVVLRLRDLLQATPQTESSGEEQALSVTLETEAQIELRRPIVQLGKREQVMLVELCRPYNLEIIAYLTGRMGIAPLMLPVELGISDGSAPHTDGGGVDSGEDNAVSS